MFWKSNDSNTTSSGDDGGGGERDSTNLNQASTTATRHNYESTSTSRAATAPEPLSENGNDTRKAGGTSPSPFNPVGSMLDRTRNEFSLRSGFNSDAAGHNGHKTYHWKDYAPSRIVQNPVRFCRWFMVGGMKYADEIPEDELAQNLAALARCIVLLRLYLKSQESERTQSQNDIVDGDGDRNDSYNDVHVILEAISSNLYSGGCPLWTTEGLMKRVCQGLCGPVESEWILLPRKAVCGITSISSSTGRIEQQHIFTYTKGYNVSLLDNIQPVITRLASFASNSESVSGVPTRLPSIEELNNATPTEEEIKEIEDDMLNENIQDVDTEELRALILDLSSQYDGLFDFVNTMEYRAINNNKVRRWYQSAGTNKSGGLDPFWKISEREREQFSRLAIEEAKDMIRTVQAKNAELLYPKWMFLLFESVASWGACLIWFSGSWYDSIVAASLAAIITLIRLSDILSKQEKLLFEVVASFIVGIIGGMIAITWPAEMCYEAISISAVLSVMQGFRIVQAVTQVMKGNTISGAADFVEAVIFTGLVTISLSFGFGSSLNILNAEYDQIYDSCDLPINQMWYFFIVPVAALAWSGSFNPHHSDLFGMAFHGTLAFAVNFAMDKAQVNTNFNLFIASLALSFSASAVSRFTGKQAIANILAGIYVLVPGAYLILNFNDQGDTLAYTEVGIRGIVIGMGIWIGGLICSPMILGTTDALVRQSQEKLRSRGMSGSFSETGSLVHKKDPLAETVLSF